MQQLLQSANVAYMLKVSYNFQHNPKRTAY